MILGKREMQNVNVVFFEAGNGGETHSQQEKKKGNRLFERTLPSQISVGETTKRFRDFFFGEK